MSVGVGGRRGVGAWGGVCEILTQSMRGALRHTVKTIIAAGESLCEILTQLMLVTTKLNVVLVCSKNLINLLQNGCFS